jgi:hypothetical protein
MTVLTLLGVVSLAFVAAFTIRAYSKDTGDGQTPRGAIIEAWLNILVGFSINYAVNWVLLPLVGASFTAAENFWLGWIYTAISICRQYAIRRWFNARLQLISKKLGKAMP